MSIQAVTHINFQGQAAAALAFYQAVFGGALTLVSYGQAGAARDPADAESIMWGQVASDSGFCIMAYDVPAGMPWRQGRNAFFVSVRGDTAEEVTALWRGLSDGADIVHALAPAQWTALYGMLSDRFGVTWVLDLAA